MADINDKLRAAARYGDVEAVESLMQDPGCNVLAGDETGMTPLMWAALSGHDACLRLLLSKSNALARDSNGQTALIWAACSDREACVGLLLPVSDALARDADGLTASEHAQKRERKSLSQLIDAYVLAKSERVSIEAAVGTVSPLERVGFRL